MSAEEEPRQVTVVDLFDSSTRQETLLEKLLNATLALNLSIEKLGLRVQAVETAVKEGFVPGPRSPSHSVVPAKSIPAKSEQRGLLVLPPGMGGPRPIIEEKISNEDLAKKQLEEENIRAQEEARLEVKRREEAERLARVEEDRKRKEEETERIRKEEIRRIEEERIRKETLEKKTRSIMSDLITNVGSGLFPDEETSGHKKTGGLFDE